jgi:hypothetical protein
MIMLCKSNYRLFVERYLFNENISMISAECIILSYTFMNTSNNIDMVAMEIKQNIFNIITTQE